jgi:penicillin-binding protein 1A
MLDLLPHTAIGEFLVVLLPSLLVFMLIYSSRILWRAVLAVAALGMAGLLVSYEVQGYPRVLVELVSNIAEFPFPYAVGFLSAVLAAGPIVRAKRLFSAWRARRRMPPVGSEQPGSGESRSVANRRLLVVVAPLVIVAVIVMAYKTIHEKDGSGLSADHAGHDKDWPLLLSMNQIVLDRDLRPICYCGVPLTPDDIPQHLKQALVAVEDRRFYIHRGVDPLGVVRALREWLGNGAIQGGSTLSQQLAKMVLLSNDRSLARKGQDIIWGVWIDAALSKDDILLTYLNRATFGWRRGRPIIGVEQAARVLFAKRARDLNLFEAAMLAGMVNAPVRLDPKRNPRRAADRAQLVLNRMVGEGYITSAEASEALKAGIKRGKAQPLWIEARYYAEWIVSELARVEPGMALSPGMRLFVTLDTLTQFHAELAVTRMLHRLEKRGAGEAALVALGKDGALRAMVGGRSFGNSQFNRTTQARRQPASAFKPFVFLRAIESGLKPATIVRDEPSLTLETALAVSDNDATVRLARRLGLESVAGAARRLGIASPLRADGSLPLGASEVTLLELTVGYAPFANDGHLLQPHGLVAVMMAGRLRHLPRRPPASVVGADHAAVMRHMLRAVVAEGTGTPANISRDAAGKTGTSQNNRDALFVGFAGQLIAGAWVGNDDGSPMHGVTGRDVSKHWANFMANECSLRARGPCQPGSMRLQMARN